MKHHAALIYGACLVLAALLGGCNWQPVARPVQPESIAEGQFVVRGMLDSAASRYAWISELRDGKTRHAIVDLKSRKRCDLPSDTAPLSSPLTPPQSDGERAFLWPLVERKDMKTRVLFSDETCAIIKFSSTAGTQPAKLNLDNDAGSVLLLGDGKGTLSLVDPFREEERLIARGVSKYAEMRRSSDAMTEEPQALWLIEGGQLRLRTLDGNLRVTLGEDVTDFQQAAFTRLRIAFIAKGNLYEAVAPDFKPRLLAQGACKPLYYGTLLSFSAPCNPPQLVRIELTTGELLEYEKGVVWQWEERGYTLEYQRDEQGTIDLYVTPPTGERTRVVPALSEVQVLDDQNIAGVDSGRRLGIWNRTRGFSAILERVERVLPFVDSRTSGLLWLVLHDFDGDMGRLSLLDESGLKLTTIAEGVPANGYDIGLLLQVPEPVVMLLRDATRLSKQDEMPARFMGTLEATLVSGELPSTIDRDVSSFTLVADPSAGGILYAVEQGERRGLWFAAL